MNAKLLSIIAAASLMIGTTAAYAQGANEHAPGQRMQNREKAPVPNQPGASGYAPGQQYREYGPKGDQPGASGYAPGRQNQGTTGRGDQTRGR